MTTTSRHYSTKLASSILVGALLAPSLALAECYPIERAPLDADCVVMPYGEQKGVWLRLDKADELRKLKLREPELQKQVDLYAGVTAALKASTVEYKGAYEAQLEATNQMAVVNKGLAHDARLAREAEAKAIEQRDAWYRSPSLWFGTGIGATILAGVIAAIVVK